MNVGHLILHPRKGTKQKREGPATQKSQYSPNQKRQSITHSFLCLIEKNSLCLFNSWKGTSTGPIRPQLFSMGGLQEWLCLGQEASSPVQENLQVQGCPACSCALSLSHRQPAALPRQPCRWKACRRWTMLCLHLSWDPALSETQRHGH